MNLLDRLAYDTGGYTVQEILSSFCIKILEIVDLVNKNEEVCDEAHSLIENIRNEVVPDLVDDIMKELQDSGYFDSLVNVTLIEQLRTELTTLLNQTVTDYTTRLDKIDNKTTNIITPEMFREHEDDDSTCFNKALDFACNNNKTLTLTQNYILDSFVINKSVNIEGNNHTIYDNDNNDIFLTINNNCRVIINNLRLELSKSKNGILNIDSNVDLNNVTVRGSIEDNILDVAVEYRKVTTSGFGNINILYTQLCKKGLYLNTTDTKVNKLLGFNCLIHLHNAGSGNFISNSHGWNLKDNKYGDYVTNSVYLLTGRGSIILSDIYADTVETAIELPPSTTDSKYTLINISNFAYFLNRSYYPNGTMNPPKLFKNLDTFKGKIGLENLQVDNGAWSDSSGTLAKLFDVRPDETRININGITNNGYSDEFNQVPITSDFTPVSEDTTYYSPFMRKYRRYKTETKIVIRATMKGGFDNDTLIYSCTLPDNLSLSPNRIANAYINRNVGQINVKCRITKDNKIEVYNDTGLSINNGNLYIFIISDSLNL